MGESESKVLTGGQEASQALLGHTMPLLQLAQRLPGPRDQRVTREDKGLDLHLQHQ